ncbi:MAG TPA: GNAT family N-acetyltransferase [Candidatus Limnocylindria bacterium]|nr:GNAT family N-acetyltransferase [Candidatus Limnocylindria bacterium]
MPDGPTIRPATVDDAAVLGRIAGRAWNLTYRGIVPDPVLDEWIDTAVGNWLRALQHRPSHGEWRAWVAQRGDAVVGYVTTTPAADEWLPPPAGAGEVTNLYLEPDAIGTGIGRALYEHGVADLRERGFNPLVIWAFRDNPRARRFYERMGLTIDAETDWVLGGVPCPIVRFRLDRPVERSA